MFAPEGKVTGFYSGKPCGGKAEELGEQVWADTVFSVFYARISQADAEDFIFQSPVGWGCVEQDTGTLNEKILTSCRDMISNKIFFCDDITVYENNIVALSNGYGLVSASGEAKTLVMLPGVDKGDRSFLL